MNEFDIARELLTEFKGNSYSYGAGVLPGVGSIAASVGRKAVMIFDRYPGSEDRAGVELAGVIEGAKPNCPREDLYRYSSAEPDYRRGHGRACAMMNPYCTVFFAPAIEGPLRLVGEIYREAGLRMYRSALKDIR